MYMVVYGDGNITTSADGRCKLFVLKEEFRPMVYTMHGCAINGYESGQMVKPVIYSIGASSGNVFISSGEANKTYGNASYPWSTSNAITFEWDLP